MKKTKFRGGEGGGFNFWDTYQLLVDSFDSGKFIEVGCWDGESTVFMAELIKKSGKDIKFYAVEPFAPFLIDGVIHQASYEVFASNTDHVKDYITLLMADSCDAARGFEDWELDMVYIDGDHEYDAVKRDLECWLPKVRSGGIIAGHDYGMDGVVKAVNELFDDFDVYPDSSWLKRL